jgi:hypothetical protein
MAIIRKLVIAGGLASALGACDSFRGGQQSIEAPATSVAAASQYPPDKAITAFYSPSPDERGGMTPEQYRDKVVRLRLLAIDARYKAFVEELHGAKAGIGLGADIATMVIGGVGTFVAGETTKSVLSAVTAVIAGSRVAVDKNLFYDQTLPAIVSQMDAERAKQRLVIEKGMAQPAATYSLANALSDLSDYERLGSIDVAIKKLTGSATEQAKVAEDTLKAFVISRNTEDATYVASQVGRDRTGTLLKAVANLSAEKAITLAKTPPVANPDVEKVVSARLASFQGTLSAAQAKDIVKMRVVLAKGKVELDAWEAALQ